MNTCTCPLLLAIACGVKGGCTIPFVAFTVEAGDRSVDEAKVGL